MVRAYIGSEEVAQGSGKTLTLIYDLKKYIIRKYPNIKYKIVTNIDFQFETHKYSINPFNTTHIKFESETIENRQEYFKAMGERTDTIFVLDEAGTWINSYTWKEIPDEFYSRLNQLRKAHIHLFYTVQRFKYVVPRLREITNPIIICEPWPKPDIEELDDPPKPRIIFQKWVKPSYMDQIDDMKHGDKEAEKALEKKVYKTKRIFWAEIKRTFPNFDTRKIINK